MTMSYFQTKPVVHSTTPTRNFRHTGRSLYVCATKDCLVFNLLTSSQVRRDLPRPKRVFLTRAEFQGSDQTGARTVVSVDIPPPSTKSKKQQPGDDTYEIWTIDLTTAGDPFDLSFETETGEMFDVATSILPSDGCRIRLDLPSQPSSAQRRFRTWF